MQQFSLSMGHALADSKGHKCTRNADLFIRIIELGEKLVHIHGLGGIVAAQKKAKKKDEQKLGARPASSEY